MVIENIKEMEESFVDELRRRMKGHMDQEMYEDEHVFRRFLRARNHNIDAAETMLRNHVNWREQNQVDTILTKYTAHRVMTSEYMTLSRLGNDLEGCPLSYLHFGCLDTKGMLNSCTYFEIEHYVIQYLETDLETVKNLNKKGGKFMDKSGVYIFNFEHFSLTSATHKKTVETLAGLVTMYEANYPEYLKTAYAINASYYFTLLWMVIKQLLSPATAKKIKIFGKTGWQEEFQQTIHPDVLPAFLGGKRTDPDGNPMCKTLIRFGGPIPETYYSFTNQNCATRLPGATKLSVSRMSKAEVTLQVLYPGSSVEWEFVVKNRDIDLSVLYKGNGAGAARVVVPQQRMETAKSSESGMCQCEKAGIYIIEFNNTYSWFHSKEIYYTASVVNPRKQDT